MGRADGARVGVMLAMQNWSGCHAGSAALLTDPFPPPRRGTEPGERWLW